MAASDVLGDRMKLYERMGSGAKLMPLLPVMVRIDGRTFSSFTRGLARPYDDRLSQMMIDTTSFLVKETNAVIGYCQSDEISLVLYSDKPGTQLYFDGKHSKLTSQLAALASVFFFRLTQEKLPKEYAEKLPTFDCRVWNVPTKEEAVNCLLWREQDATKNSITMAARTCYSDKQLFGKHGGEMQELLFQKGINWNDYPAFFKRGTYIQRRVLATPFTTEELDKLPPLHHARRDPNLVIERSEFRAIDMPPIARVTNRVGVVFHGLDPILQQEEQTGG
jgi:tRNA(His) 5'-end guanylyltransferase